MSWSPSRRVRVEGHTSVDLHRWELEADDGSRLPVTVPGTVTQAHPDAVDADLRSWVFRTVLDQPTAAPDELLELVLEGVATSYTVELYDTVLATGTSMHAALRIDVTGLVRPGAVLTLRCLPLATALPPGKPPRARWRTRLVDDNSLRLVRTTLLGRCPGIAPGPPVVGPYRSVRLERLTRLRVTALTLATSVRGSAGQLEITCALEGIGTTPRAVTAHCAGVSLPLSPADGRWTGRLSVEDVALWWPATHGSPDLHEVTLTVDTEDGSVQVDAGRVGFRTVTQRGDVDVAGLDVLVNGVPVFLRGAVWTPPGLLAGRPEAPHDTVRLARDTGMNLLRVPGLAVYEDDAFFDACDELGVLVWHDLALANLDVPHDLLGPQLDQELADLLGRSGGRPCLLAVCGGSETAQQVAMLGLAPDLWRSPFLDEQAPAAVGDRAVWVANSPVGGDLPFRVGVGVAHWFGVGGYRRPLSDARTSGVRFASECLALSHLPDGPLPAPDDPAWSTGIPRDNGSDWDFEDVREHYLQLLRGTPPDLRKQDPERWTALSEAVSGELCGTVFGELRRAGSVTRGALLLWLRDVVPGAGWGLVDAVGRPKAALGPVRRALAPQAIWFTDEGLDGLLVQVANDRAEPWSGELRVATYRPDDLRLDEVTLPLTVPGRGHWTGGVEALLGRFVDASYAFRFGGPSHHAVVATFHDGAEDRQAFCFPAGRDLAAVDRASLTVTRLSDDVLLTSTRLLDGVRVRGEGQSSDDSFCLEPGHPRRIGGLTGPVTVTALNLRA